MRIGLAGPANKGRLLRIWTFAAVVAVLAGFPHAGQSPAAASQTNIEISELLRAIDAHQQATGSEGSLFDPAYLLKAIERLEARLAAEPSPSEVDLLALPLLYFRINRNARAVDMLKSYLKENPGSSRGQLLLAFGYVREQKYLQAESQVLEILKRESNNSYGHYLLGLSRLGRNQLAGATASFQKAVDLDPQFGQAHLQLGQLHSKQPETMATAYQAFLRALDAGLEQPEVYAGLGYALLQLGRPREAVAELEKAAELQPDDPQAHYLLADAYRKLGLQERSAAALERFAALQASATVRNEEQSRGLAYFEEGMKLLADDEFEAAYEKFERTVEVFPGLAAAYYRRAQIGFLIKRFDEGLSCIRQAIALNPLDEEYYFVLARFLERAVDLGGAVEAIRNAIALEPGVGEFHNLLGNLLMKERDYAGAAQAYRQATAIEADNASFHLNLSVALARLGAGEESQKARQRYLELVNGRTP